MMTGFAIHLKSKGLAQNTVRLTLSRTERILNECQPLTKETFETFLVALFDSVSAAAVNKYIQAIKAYGAYQNISWTKELKQVKEQSAPRFLLSDEEIEQIIEVKPLPDRLSVFWATIAFTGARPSEIASLTKDSVDLKTGTIYITATKTKSTRTVPISDRLKLVLNEYIPSVPNQLLFYIKGKPNKPMYSDQLRADFRDRLKKLGITKKVTPYSLRHSFITRILDNEANLFAVQGIVGHKKADTTQAYYKESLKAKRKATRRDPMNAMVLSPEQRLKQTVEELQKTGIFETPGITYQISNNKIIIELSTEKRTVEANETSLAALRLALD